MLPLLLLLPDFLPNNWHGYRGAGHLGLMSSLRPWYSARLARVLAPKEAALGEMP